jgi:hypothetical protein
VNWFPNRNPRKITTADGPCGPQELRADTPHAAYLNDLIATLHRLVQALAEEVTH